MRYHTLDTLRGANVISMVCYHAIWDAVNMFHQRLFWFPSLFSFLWQQSICIGFILLSGFCWSMGHKKWKRGLLVFLFGILITVITWTVTPQQRILFGVLTLLGSCMLILIPLEQKLKRISPFLGGIVSLSLFILFRNINDGYLGIGSWILIRLPKWLYRGMFSTYLGFKDPEFYSADYFSIFPWIFLFLTGYFLYEMMRKKEKLWIVKGKERGILDVLGRYSLFIYLVHQPLIFGTLSILDGHFF